MLHYHEMTDGQLQREEEELAFYAEAMLRSSEVVDNRQMAINHINITLTNIRKELQDRYELNNY